MLRRHESSKPVICRLLSVRLQMGVGVKKSVLRLSWVRNQPCPPINAHIHCTVSLHATCTARPRIDAVSQQAELANRVCCAPVAQPTYRQVKLAGVDVAREPRPRPPRAQNDESRPACPERDRLGLEPTRRGKSTALPCVAGELSAAGPQQRRCKGVRAFPRLGHAPRQQLRWDQTSERKHTQINRWQT